MKTLFKGFRKYSRWARCKRRILNYKATQEAIRIHLLKYYQQYPELNSLPDCSEWKVKGVAK